jgi:hypothetical protein
MKRSALPLVLGVQGRVKMCARACLHSSEPVERGDDEDEAHEACEGFLAAQGDAAEG